jgi:hypothetical protein
VPTFFSPTRQTSCVKSFTDLHLWPRTPRQLLSSLPRRASLALQSSRNSWRHLASRIRRISLHSTRSSLISARAVMYITSHRSRFSLPDLPRSTRHLACRLRRPVPLVADQDTLNTPHHSVIHPRVSQWSHLLIATRHCSLHPSAYPRFEIPTSLHTL